MTGLWSDGPTPAVSVGMTSSCRLPGPVAVPTVIVPDTVLSRYELITVVPAALIVSPTRWLFSSHRFATPCVPSRFNVWPWMV